MGGDPDVVKLRVFVVHKFQPWYPKNFLANRVAQPTLW